MENISCILMRIHNALYESHLKKKLGMIIIVMCLYPYLTHFSSVPLR